MDVHKFGDCLAVLFCSFKKYTFQDKGKERIIMKRYGYHRTITREQHLDRGIKEITAYCEQNQLELVVGI